LVDLITRGGVPKTEAYERARNIAQIVQLGELDYRNISDMLKPIQGFRNGIENDEIRVRISQLVMCQIIRDASEDKYLFSKDTAYRMYAEMTEAEAIDKLDKIQPAQPCGENVTVTT